MRTTVMKTTMNLPIDVLALLRTESARRGGRARASMGALVAESVREKFAANKPKKDLFKIVKRNGHYVVTAPKGTPMISDEAVKAALEDWS